MADPATAAPQVKPVSENKPPKALMLVMNPLMKLLLRSPLRGNIGKGLLLITFTGRKSGKRYTTPVAYQDRGSTLIIFVDGRWWRNLLGGAPVAVLVDGQQWAGQAEAITDPDVVVAGMLEFLRLRGLDHARQLGLRLADPTREPTAEELRIMTKGRALVRVSLPGRKQPAAG